MSNKQHITVGKIRNDGDIDIIAVINASHFHDDGQILAALVAVIRAGVANSKEVRIWERQDAPDTVNINE